MSMQVKIKSLTGVLYKIDCEEKDTTFTLKVWLCGFFSYYSFFFPFWSKRFGLWDVFIGEVAREVGCGARTGAAYFFFLFFSLLFFS